MNERSRSIPISSRRAPFRSLTLTSLLHGLILPSIWLNALFANQTWSSALSFLGQMFYWLSLLLAATIACKAFGRQGWPFLIVLTMVGSRFASLVGLSDFYLIYFALMLVLFAVSGIALAIEAPWILYSQSKTFLLLSLPVMFAQVAGITEWLQTFNTLYNVAGADGSAIHPEIRLLPLLFTSGAELMETRYADFQQFLSMQSRPPGLTHSSAILAVFILASAALHFGRLVGARVTLRDVTLVCVVVLSGAKLALLGFVFMTLVAIVQHRQPVRGRLSRILGILAVALVVYIFLFPASAVHNFGAEAFETSFLSRAVDAAVAIVPDLAYFPEVSEIMGTYTTIFTEGRNDFGALSGLVTLVKNLPFLLIALLVSLPWWIRGSRWCRLVAVERARTAQLMILVLFVVPFATPLLGSPFYALCIGVAMTPVAVGLSSRLRRRLLYRVGPRSMKSYDENKFPAALRWSQ